MIRDKGAKVMHQHNDRDGPAKFGDSAPVPVLKRSEALRMESPTNVLFITLRTPRSHRPDHIE